MPLVVVNYQKNEIDPVIVRNVANGLPKIVARALDVVGNEQARLSAGDIEVWVQEAGSQDVNGKGLEIVIWANEYPERLANLNDRKEEILRGVRDLLPHYPGNLTGFVWVLLQPGAFGEI